MSTVAPRGFTLIEVAITLVVLGVLISLGLPSFTTWINNTKIRTAAESMLNGVQLARAEAVRQNQTMVFILGASGNWTVQTQAGSVIQQRPANEGSSNTTLTITPSGATEITFNGLGRVIANGDASASISSITVGSTILSSSQARNMTINIGLGSVRMCDPLVSQPDPRAC